MIIIVFDALIVAGETIKSAEFYGSALITGLSAGATPSLVLTQTSSQADPFSGPYLMDFYYS